MSALRACPFCRTLYRPDEGNVCAECGVALVPMQKLELSHEAQLEEPPELILPEDRRLPILDLSRGRGALLGLALLGLVLFFTPWVEIVRPEIEVRSGFELARGRVGWLWGGATGYFVLLPLVFTRRSIGAMRGVRLVVAMLASMTLCEVAVMLALPPRGQGLVPVLIQWEWGLYASGVVSLIATFFALRFGGALPPLPPGVVDAEAEPPPIRPSGETLH